MHALLAAASAALALAPGDRVADWTDDVLHLVAEIERLHPDPFGTTPREEFEAAIDDFLAGIEQHGDERLVVELMRLVALLSKGARDGHSFVWSSSFHPLPLQLHRFDDGWFVVAARAPYSHLVGARLVALGPTPVEQAEEHILPIVCRDNEWDALSKLELLLLTPEILAALALVPDAREVELRVERAGAIETCAVRPSDGARPEHLLPPIGDGLCYRDRRQSWWYEVLEQERALYVQYNEVRTANEQGETLASFAAELSRTFEERKLERLILDLRSNGGGDNTTFGPLVDALRANARLNQTGRLFVLIGRSTFSAAGNFVTVIDRDTQALLVGEPTGGAPNQFGDARAVVLPHHKDVQVSIATRYHTFGGPQDRRSTHEPDLPVPLRSDDYFAGRDPVLERALTYAGASPSGQSVPK